MQDKLAITFFISRIVYLADAVGTQTETIIVRGLSVGVSIKKALLQELLTGILIGFTLAGLAYPFLVWNWEDSNLAISLSLLAACSTATVIALVLPVLFNVLDIDPAFGMRSDSYRYSRCFINYDLFSDCNSYYVLTNNYRTVYPPSTTNSHPIMEEA